MQESNIFAERKLIIEIYTLEEDPFQFLKACNSIHLISLWAKKGIDSFSQKNWSLGESIPLVELIPLDELIAHFEIHSCNILILRLIFRS